VKTIVKRQLKEERGSTEHFIYILVSL